jgi:hypothetical protein
VVAAWAGSAASRPSAAPVNCRLFERIGGYPPGSIPTG